MIDDSVPTDAELLDEVRNNPGGDPALATIPFEAMEMPSHLGASLHQLLRTTCPTALAPCQRCWRLFVSPGSVSPGDVEAAEGSLLRGDHGWVPVPGNWTETTGRIGWLVHPAEAHWQPYRRSVPIAGVLSAESKM